MTNQVWKSVPVDKVTQHVVGGVLDTIAREMGWALYRIAYSPIIRESEDLGAGIFGVDGQTICESDTTPMQFGALPYVVRAIVEQNPDDIFEGDIFLHNNPYQGASHSSDMSVVAPIFWEGKLVAFAVTAAHWIDIGGATPGITDNVPDIWGEGKIFSAIKLYEKGVLNKPLKKFLMENVRTPDLNNGDLNAQIGAVKMGERRFKEALESYGLDIIFSASEQWMDYSEARLREEIQKIPDGEYYAEGWLDDDAVNRDQPLKVCVTVTVKDSDIKVDLTGSAPETMTACNVPFEGTTKVSVYYGIRALLLDQARLEDHVPQNDGIFRPIEIVAPLGTIFNPRYPRANTSRFCQAQRVADLCIQALAPALPDKVTAGSSAAMVGCAYALYDQKTEQYRVHVEVNEGSYGGSQGKDGIDSIDCHLANTRNTPIEEMEMHFPLRTERYEFRDEEPAAGEWRGGIGIVRDNRFLEPGTFSCQGDRHYEAPNGLFGGEDGAVGTVTKNPDGASEQALYSKNIGLSMEAGDMVRIIVPNAGGYGDPFKRAADKVLQDVRDGLVSVESAREKYGVAIADNQVDETATTNLRASR